MKEDEIINLSIQCNFNAIKASPLKLEASGREYWRVTNEDNSMILCYLDPSIGDHSDFIKITNSLKENNINKINNIKNDKIKQSLLELNKLFKTK